MSGFKLSRCSRGKEETEMLEKRNEPGFTPRSNFVAAFDGHSSVPLERARWGRGVWRCLFVLALGMLSVGCPQKTEPEGESTLAPTSTEPIKVLVVAEPEAAQEIERFWNAEAATPMTATAMTASEFEAASDEKLSSFDVLLYPSQLLPTLANQGTLLPIEERRFEAEEWNKSDVLPLERATATRWGDKVYGVSLGHRPWVLAYRADILESLNEPTPEIWEDYGRTAMRLTEPPAGVAVESGSWQGTAEPTASPWGAHLLLARAGSGIRHRGAYSGLFELGQVEPLIGSPPYVQALDEIASHCGTLGTTPEECWELLASGKVAMAIMPVLAHPKPEAVEGEEAGVAEVGAEGNVSSLIRFAPLPGSVDVFESQQQEWRRRSSSEPPRVPYLGRPGMVASLTAKTRRSGTAWGLMQWLTSRKTQPRLGELLPLSFPTRFSTLPSIDRWLPSNISAQGMDDLIAVIRADNEANVTMQSLRIPGESTYLGLLQQAVEKRVAGGESAGLLEEAVGGWKTEIEKLGAPAFSQMHEASLGL